MEQVHLNMPLSNMQLELLKLFSRNLDETDLMALKRMMVKYLAQKATKLADEVWDEKKWTEKDMDDLLNTHEHSPYNPK
ncbi:MAG: hypothetical protein K9H64_04945 [Bacteroidales bacterium]|nr:hypothetical protein [Bacteroidales bacterium]MCF8455184.1 hypothetical protein [Bacteroidales bacterium]